MEPNPECIFKLDELNQQICIYRFYENYHELSTHVHLYEQEVKMFNSFKSDNRKKEFLAVRYILHHILKSSQMVSYNNDGSPILANGYISISHSHDFIGVALSHGTIGLDIETISNKILKVKHKFLNEAELHFAGDDLQLLHSCWAVKEAIYKYISTDSVDFKNEIYIQPFRMKDGKATAIYNDKMYMVNVKLEGELVIAYL